MSMKKYRLVSVYYCTELKINIDTLFFLPQVCENGLEQVLQVGGHKSPVVTVDWCNALQCGTSVAAALDGSVTVATLMRQ